MQPTCLSKSEQEQYDCQNQEGDGCRHSWSAQIFWGKVDLQEALGCKRTFRWWFPQILGQKFSFWSIISFQNLHSYNFITKIAWDNFHFILYYFILFYILLASLFISLDRKLHSYFLKTVVAVTRIWKYWDTRRKSC